MQQYAGTTFLEVLISLFILSFILLGLTVLQFITIQKLRSAYYVSVATEQVTSMKERIQSSNTNDIESQVIIWNKQNQSLLPNGRGIVMGHYPDYQLSIFWGNTHDTHCYSAKTGATGCLSLSMKKSLESC